MVNFILDLISFNEGIDYSTVSKIVVGDLILLWIFVSIWVFNDAKLRFNNLIVAAFLGVLNLVLSFPFLLIYLLIRPSHRDEWDDSSDGGINIPVANFTGKEGVVISLQLKIDTKKILDEKTDYNLDIVLNKDNEEPSTGKIEISSQSPEVITLNESNNDLKNSRKSLSSLKVKLKAFVSNLKSKLDRDNQDESGSREEGDSDFSESSSESEKSFTKKKKKGKKGKKKKNR